MWARKAGEGEGGHQAETRTARYAVDFSHEQQLWRTVEEGRRRIKEWLQLVDAN